MWVEPREAVRPSAVARSAPDPVADEVDPLGRTALDQPRGGPDTGGARLIAAMTFLDGVAHHGTAARFLQWWNEDVRPLGCVAAVSSIRETGHRPIALDGLEEVPQALRALLVAARRNVVVALESALRDPRTLSDVLVQTGLVAPDAQGGWSPSVGPDRALSDLLLALVVSDMLDRPRLYRDRFALCQRCDRISFQRALTGRRGCLEHRVKDR